MSGWHENSAHKYDMKKQNKQQAQVVIYVDKQNQTNKETGVEKCGEETFSRHHQPPFRCAPLRQEPKHATSRQMKHRLHARVQ